MYENTKNLFFLWNEVVVSLWADNVNQLNQEEK